MTLVSRELEVRYGSRIALQPTTLELAPGEFVALVGPNGAGKSSLLKALAGLAAYAGTVSWRGTPLAKLGDQQRARSIAYLPQAPTFHWPLLARDLVALGRLPHRAYGAAASGADHEAVEWALQQTATTAFAARNVDRLSVGERARVLLARALAVRAPVLLVDEPTAMLDPYHQLEIMAMLRAYASADSADVTGGGRSRGLVVAVLHDLTLAARFCNRVLLLHAGAVVADDGPEQALNAAAVRRHYGVEPFISRYDGEPVIVPWRPLDD
jgi:iron complex transport system ATP-binding protein